MASEIVETQVEDPAEYPGTAVLEASEDVQDYLEEIAPAEADKEILETIAEEIVEETIESPGPP